MAKITESRNVETVRTCVMEREEIERLICDALGVVRSVPIEWITDDGDVLRAVIVQRNTAYGEPLEIKAPT